MPYNPELWFKDPQQREATLRDEFAIAALSHPIVANVMTPGTAATRAYILADAMLKARREFPDFE